ncbi:hypothetical protein E5Q_03027 [Mixia osmundae IAM 14324]|uniref:Ubiquitin-like-conjugating enzyme ATG10 n=1 Tax=Mixia osmundae (strain CBS 9802 / IAM 14324 / JCM 22182 / KY 12970) TaxID=764103 RepID=G7E0K1_MIXOS|nr:hypothetical protein E5Q_03027 [Mixia osmundae IAM 14324]
MLDRHAFNEACRAWLTTEGRSTSWQWLTPSSLPDYGYLQRAQLHCAARDVSATAEDDLIGQEDTVQEVADPSSANGTEYQSLRLDCSICYSATFQVPVLYFRGFSQGGAPLQLKDILQSSFIKPDAPSTLSISQGEHPVAGTACHFLHPCNTAELIREIKLASADTSDAVLPTWLMILDQVDSTCDGQGCTLATVDDRLIGTTSVRRWVIAIWSASMSQS